MKVKVSKASGLVLDWMVAKCEGVYLSEPVPLDVGCVPFHPSTDWAQGGPIIEREIHAFDHMQSSRVCAIIKRKDLKNGGFNHGYGPTPLIAAMRCLCVSKLGDEVEVPDAIAA